MVHFDRHIFRLIHHIASESDTHIIDVYTVYDFIFDSYKIYLKFYLLCCFFRRENNS